MGGFIMPYQTTLAIILISMPFVIFMTILAYGDYQTNHRVGK